MTRSKFIRAAVVAASLMVAGAASAQTSFYGLTSRNAGRNLVSFTSAAPGTFTSNIAITGATTNTGTIVDLFALDLNTSNGQLYALGSAGGGEYALFRIGYDGVATRIGTNLGVNIGTENAGLDYDSAAGVFRVLTTDEQAFSVNPTTGVGTFTGTFAYAPGDTRGSPTNPNVVSAAYNGQLYVLDRNGAGATSVLSTMTGNTLNSVASIGLNLNANASFDIAQNGLAFFDSGQVSDRLYQLDLTNGSFTDLGALELRLTGLTAAGIAAAVPEPATWLSMILGFGLIGGVMRRRRTAKLATA